MEWQEALTIVVVETGIERYRILCSDDSPFPGEVEKYRALMIRKATGQPEPARNDAALRAYLAEHGCGGC